MSLTQIQSAYVWKSKFQSLKMPDWEQLVSVGVADAWRVVRREVSQSIEFLKSSYLLHPFAVQKSFCLPQVAKELFPGLLAVPHLLQADFYDLMVCFTKCPTNAIDKMARVGPVYRLHGHIADLVATEETDIPELVVMCKHPSQEDICLPNFSRTWTKGDKAIMVKLGGLSKLVTNWTITEGKLVMDTSIKELAEAGKVYVISEVIYAETVIVEVDSKKTSEAVEMKRIPVAFSYFKFPMSSGGVLQPGKDKRGVNKDADFLLIDNDQTEKI